MSPAVMSTHCMSGVDVSLRGCGMEECPLRSSSAFPTELFSQHSLTLTLRPIIAVAVVKSPVYVKPASR